MRGGWPSFTPYTERHTMKFLLIMLLAITTPAMSASQHDADNMAQAAVVKEIAMFTASAASSSNSGLADIAVQNYFIAVTFYQWPGITIPPNEITDVATLKAAGDTDSNEAESSRNVGHARKASGEGWYQLGDLYYGIQDYNLAAYSYGQALVEYNHAKNWYNASAQEYYEAILKYNEAAALIEEYSEDDD